MFIKIFKIFIILQLFNNNNNIINVNCNNVSSDVLDGQCVKYIANPVKKYGSPCGGIIDTYFLPDGETQESIEQNIVVVHDLFTEMPYHLHSIIGISDAAVDQFPACMIPLRYVLCHTYFPKCSTTGPPAPIQPCVSSCEKINSFAECGLVFGSLSMTPLDCSALDSITNTYELYSNTTTKFNNTIVLPCNSNVPDDLISAAASGTTPTKYCVPPTLYPSVDGKECIVACGTNLLEADAEYVSARKVNHALSYISLILSVCVIITWLSYPGKLKFPTSIVLYLSIASLCISIGFILGENANHCVSKNQSVTPKNSAVCFFEYSFIHGGSLLACFWWLAISVNMFCVIVLEMTDISTKYEKYFHIICWGFPFILWFLPLVTDSVGYSELTDLCWIDSQSVLFVGYYIVWVIVICCLGATCMLSAIIKVIMITRDQMNMSKQTSLSSANKQIRKRIHSQIRSFIFIIFFLLTYSSFFSFYFIYKKASEEESTQISALQLAVCIAEGGSFNNCPYTTPFDMNVVSLVLYMTAAQGIFISVIFAGNLDIIRFWRNRIGFTTDSINEKHGLSGRASATANMSSSARNKKKNFTNGTVDDSNGTQSTIIELEGTDVAVMARPVTTSAAGTESISSV